MAKLLRLTNDDNLIVNHILDHTPENSVVFLTGVGKAFPFVRSHNVLNNLHQVLDKVPGVKVNYAKFQGIEVGGDGEKKQTINLLAKI